MDKTKVTIKKEPLDEVITTKGVRKNMRVKVLPESRKVFDVRDAMKQKIPEDKDPPPKLSSVIKVRDKFHREIKYHKAR